MGTDFLIDLKTMEGVHFKILTRNPPSFRVDSIITMGIDIESVWLIPENLEDI